MQESRKVRKTNGLAVCSMDIVGAAQADCDAPQSFGDEFERKAGEESDAVHTHEGRADEELRGPHSGAGHREGEVRRRAGPREAEGDRQHREARGGGEDERVQAGRPRVEDNKGDIVRSRFVAKQVAYNQRDDVSQSTPALLIFRLLLSIAVSIAPIFCGSAVVLSCSDISVALFHAVMDELVCVHPPRDLVPPGWCWKLRRVPLRRKDG